jgi:hypothetical protein
MKKIFIILLQALILIIFYSCAKKSPFTPVLPSATFTNTIPAPTATQTVTVTHNASTATTTATATTTSLPAYANAYEPDDSYAQANWIFSNTPQTRSIYPAIDTDWVKFSVTQPSGAVLETSGIPGGNTVLTLYVSTDLVNPVASNDDKNYPSDLYSKIDTELPAGVYYLKITSFNSVSEISEYTISLLINYLTPTPTYTATPTVTDTVVQTATFTCTVTNTHTRTATGTFTSTATVTITKTPGWHIITSGITGVTNVSLASSGTDYSYGYILSNTLYVNGTAICNNVKAGSMNRKWLAKPGAVTYAVYVDTNNDVYVKTSSDWSTALGGTKVATIAATDEYPAIYVDGTTPYVVTNSTSKYFNGTSWATHALGGGMGTNYSTSVFKGYKGTNLHFAYREGSLVNKWDGTQWVCPDPCDPINLEYHPGNPSILLFTKDIAIDIDPTNGQLYFAQWASENDGIWIDNYLFVKDFPSLTRVGSTTMGSSWLVTAGPTTLPSGKWVDLKVVSSILHHLLQC